MSDQPFGDEIGIGATVELSLRVSVAALVRVIFNHPRSGEWMLALERKAIILDKIGERLVAVKSQPFGGALRILDVETLQHTIGEFHFDNDRSRSERDFRIFIRPSAWESVRDFCAEGLSRADDPILESDPRRELEEELAEALNISLRPEQYSCHAVGTVIEDKCSPTENFFAKGALTARVYRVFEARILDPSLADALMANSQRYADRDLEKLAHLNFREGGSGWANAVLTLPLKQISSLYTATSLEARDQPILFQNHKIDETVAAVLEGVNVPKYRRL